MLKAKIIKLVYKNILKPILFLRDPEAVHDGFTKIGHILGKYKIFRFATKLVFNYKNPALEQNVAGINFKNPVGLSAGFDKNAELIEIMPNVGFGFMQVGTITHNPYEGNPKPRLTRLKKSKAIVVYYGLKNIGAQKIIDKIKKTKTENFPIGISIGKTNCTGTATAEKGVEDYYNCLKEVIEGEIGDLYTINISCPNTFGGEPFTDSIKLENLLIKLTTLGIKKPIFLKMPINSPWEEFKELLEIAVKYKINGVIIGNLNKDHKSKTIKDIIPENAKGGISGKPCWELSNELISKTYKNYGNKLIIIGVGGIFSAEDAYEKIKLGASLVQLITGMIFEGPQLIGEINAGLVELLKKDGYKNISEAVGKSNTSSTSK